jgi:methane monooxygenase component C
MQEYRVRMTFEGQHPIEMGCRADEDVVTAGLRQGVLIVSDCRKGACGACRAFLEEGQYDQLLEHSQHALSEDDEDEGWVLSCRLRPRSDIALDFDYPIDRVSRLDASRRSGRIVAIDRCSPTVLRLVVRTMAAQAPLAWKPGQYVRLELTRAGVTRSFSPANLAGDGHDIEFFIRLLPGGAFSRTLRAMPGPGDMVAVEGPLGGFTLDPAGEHDLVFVAGGTGLAPVLSILRQLGAEQPTRRATLIFGAAREDELFATADLQALQVGFPGLRVELAADAAQDSWAGFRGTAVDRLAALVQADPDHAARHYYLCGPQAMVAAAHTLLTRQFAVPAGAVHQEPFLPSEG